MTDINRLLASLKRRSSHAKEFGHDVLFVKLEDIDVLVETIEKSKEESGFDRIVDGIKADVWMEGKDFTKSVLASDSVDHLDFLFDGKVQQLCKVVDK